MANLYARRSILFISAILLLATPLRSIGQCPVVPDFVFEKSCSEDFRINFANNSTVNPPGQIDYYQWHFGDATTSTATNPSHTYPGAGIYQVILYVYDTSGCYDSIIQNVETTALPVANFSYSQSGCGEITFANNSTYAGANPAWFWTFGDGQISTVMNPVHIYLTGGAKNVSLTVTDDYGCSNTYFFAIAVFPPATVDFTYDQTNCDLVQFFDNSTGTGLITRLWDFGDGFTSTAVNPTHSFALGASYVVSLTISDQYCSGLIYTDTLVFPNPPAASFTFGPDGQCSSTPITFDASTSTGTSLNYSWDFGDGNTVNGLFLPTTNYTYSSYNNAACDLTQSYNVQLTVTDGIGCTDTDNGLVSTQRIPRPLLMDMSGNNFQNCYSVNPANPIDTLQVNNITPNMACITHLDISWGDGTDTLNLSGADFPLSHVYMSLGEFPLTITAYGINGCVSDTTYVVANQVNPSVGISGVGSNSGCAPYTARFVLHGYTGNSLGTTYTWNFDDGTTVSWDYNQPYINDTIEHVYTQSHCANPLASSPDGYIPSVTAENACGIWTSTIQYMTIFESPIASFTSIDTSNYGCYADPFCFLNYTYHGYSSSCDSAVFYTWDFGDGNSSNAAEPCHSYAYPGTYHVNLLADNPLCGGTDTTITIHITGVHADFVFDTVCLGNETHFTSLSWAYDDSSFLSNPAIVITDWFWDFGDGTNSILQNPNHIYPDTGIYTVSLTVTSEYGCDSTMIHDVYVGGLFIDDVIVDSITCYGDDNGAITVLLAGGTPSFTYTLFPGNITNTSGFFNNLSPGTYWVLAQDAIGCWDETDTIYMTEPDTIHIDSIQFTDIICHNDNDGTITTFASGGTNPLNYTLIPPGTTNSSGIFTSLSAGNYRVVVNDINGCPADTSFFVTITNPPPVIIDSLQSTDIRCHNANDGLIQVWAQGGTGTLTYTLNPGGASNTTGIFSGLSGGTYTVTVSDDNGCSETTPDIIIISPAAILINTVAFTNMSCHDTLDGSITVIASGGAGGLFYTLLPSVIINSSGLFTGLGEGNYYVRVTDINGCSDSTGNITIVNPGEILITNENITPITCYNANDGIIEVIAGGGNLPYVYTLFPPLTQNGTGLFSGLSPGTYYVIVEDANGCPSDTSSIFTLTNPLELLIDSTQYDDITCHGYDDGWIQLWAHGGSGSLTYTLNPGGISNSTGLFNGLSANAYTVNVSDTNGCNLSTAVITIVDPPGVNVSVTHTDVSCFSMNDGSINIMAGGGVGLLDYSIDNGFTYFTFSNFTALGPGNYIVRVRDANGCETNGILVTIIEPPLLQITGFTPLTPTCAGCSDGEITAHVSGGSVPYSHSWSNGMNGNPITGLSSGWYTDTVSDANGCQAIDSVFLPDTLALTFVFSDTICFGTTDGWATVFVTGGVPPYLYLWSGGSGATTDSIYNLSAGTYIVTVTDQHACQTIDSVTIIENPELLLVVSTTSSLICSGDSVQLNAAVTGGTLPVASYLWSPSASLSDPTAQSPVAIPAVTTTYTVLIADQRGCTAIDSVIVNVTPSPTADFIYQNPCASNIVNFLNLSNANGNVLVAYDWDFGDGYFSNLQHPTHTYGTVDTTYTVTLVAQNSNGCTDTITQGVFVNPTLGLTVEADSSCIGNPTHFNDSVSNPLAVIVSYFYDFGDGHTDTVSDPVHLYSLPGLYLVNVQVEDTSGCVEASSLQVRVHALPFPDFSDSTSCTTDFTYFTDLTDTTAIGINSWHWDFGDGNTSNIQHPVHFYMVSGTYQVQLTIENTNGCVDSITKAVVVYPGPTAAFQTDTVCLGEPSHFTDLSTASFGVINSWLWDFGDGNTSSQQNPIHFYSSPGFYNVILIIGSTTGCYDTIAHIAGVDATPEAAFTNSAPACEASLVSFTDLSVANADSLVGWYWDFGDGYTSNLQHPQHVFPGGGNYSINLTVTNSDGCVDDTTMMIMVLSSPTADFIVNASPCANDTTFFIDISTPSMGFLTSWEWLFGDGSSSTLQHPNHVYASSGLYDITLVVTNSLGCSDTLAQSILIYPQPVADFSLSPGCMGVPTNFFDLSTTTIGQISSWYWNFGDPGSGTLDISSLQNPSHIYVFAGVYDVSLIVSNTNGCYDTIVQQINIHPNPTVGFNFEHACDDDSTIFLDISLPGVAPLQNWHWDFGDGATSTYTSFQDSVFHVYNNAGQYHVTLTVTDSVGCSDYQTRMVVVYARPTALFEYNMSCVNNITHFTDYSNGSGADIVAWYWDFGDPASGLLNYSTLQNPTHEYSVAGDYFVTLWVENAEGCTNQSTQIITVTPGPVADFEADSTCVGFITFFDNLSYAIGENIISWHWDFGDGNSSILQYPSHVYSSAGVYWVSLTVETENGCIDNVVKPITVNELPEPDFTYSTPNCFPDSTYFTDLSWFVGGNVITSWHWDFGDGTTDTINQNPVHSYAVPGTYNVSLMVYDTNDCFNAVILPVYVNPGPIAGFDHQSTSCDTVYFTDMSIGAGDTIISWYWEFGDPASGWNNFSTQQHPMHVFINSGTYDVMLVVTDALGCTDTTWQSLDVYKPVADFIVDNSCVNSSAQFTDLSWVTGDVIVSWAWDFGDGTSSSVQDPIHVYTAPGTYFVTLTVTTSAGCIANTVQNIEVNFPPTADFEFTSTCFGEDIHFTDLSFTSGFGPVVSWAWDFGDGNTSNLQNPVHTYAAMGSYTVSLVAYDTNGCYDTHIENIGVFDGPDASFSLTNACAGQPTQFTDLTSASVMPVVSWYWEFGDGDTSNLQNPWHIYMSSGTYTVTLTVTDMGGCEDVVIQTIDILDAPMAGFEVDSTCVGSPTYFTDLSLPASDIVAWYWNFGDPLSGMANFAFVQNPTHTFSLEGTYTVSLTVTNITGCSHTITQQIWVEPPPIADFTFTNEHCVGEPVLFIDLSQTVYEVIIMWIWDFGDGQRDTIYHPANPNIEHIYTTPGQKLVTLTVTNVGECVGITSKPINILPDPSADFEYTTACEDLLVQFTDMSDQNGGGQVINWWWDFGDPLSGSTNNSQLQNPEHMFTGPGLFDVTLIVWNDNSCRDTITRILDVRPKPPADFYWDSSCVGQLTQFYINDTVVNVNTTTTYLWNFGDGTWSNLKNPAHLFPSYGIYEVTLTITDTSMCENTVSKEVTVDEAPLAFFDISEPTCNGDSVFFDDLSSTTWGYIETWIWDFDDGSPLDTIHFPDDPNVFHTYAGTGTYGATLTVINTNGCSHTFTREVDILAKPTANFHWSANPCQGETVYFSDASFPNGQGNILSWYWEFDDPMSGINNTSIQQNPVHIFSEGGVYDVLLIVVNFTNCTDTIVKSLYVNDSPDVAFLWDGLCEDTLTYFYPDSSGMAVSSVTSWHWDFGDGNYANIATPSHMYQNSGYYNVTLTIQDTGVCTTSHTEQILVNTGPIAHYDVSQVNCAGSLVYFEDLSSVPDSYLIEWFWDFGDGYDTTIYFPDDPNVSHSYLSEGTYPVTLTVMSADGCYGEYFEYVMIDAAPIALFDYDPTCNDLPTQFWDNSSGGGGLLISSWYWDFGDPQSGINNTSSLQNPEHIYADTGTYDVSLLITNVGGCVDSIMQQVFVSGGEPVDFFAEDSCLNLLTYFFIDPAVTDTTAVQLYQWDFGDGSPTSTLMCPSHMYAEAGIYQVTLSIWDFAGCSNTIMHEVEVRDNPTALFKYDAACASDTAYFSDLSYTQNGDLIVAWFWDFGDPGSGMANYSTLQHPVHVFTGMNNYDVKLLVSTDHGCRDSIVIPVAASSNPTSNFTYNVNPCDQGLVYFNDSSTVMQSPIIEWEWEMEPGSFAYVPDPYYIFLLTDTTYLVSLKVTDANGCSDMIMKEVFVPAGLEVEVINSQTCYLNPMHFSAAILQPLPDSLFTYSWNFGEPASGPNNTSSLATPQHIYQDAGYYTVNLIATDIHGCETTVYKEVQVDALPVPEFSFTGNLCDSTIYFTDLSFGNASGIVSWHWDFGDGSPPELLTSPPGHTSHFYEDEGVYTVALSVTNALGCINTVTHEVEREPCLNAAFFVLNNATCERSTISFADHSSVDFLIEQWQWSFGDGTDTLYTAKADTVNHYYGTSGDYYVQLIVSAVFNGVVVADTFAQNIQISRTPQPTFSNQTVCFGDPTKFIDETEQNGAVITQWSWDFNTGNVGDTSVFRNPLFKFDTAGTYNVSLVVVNQYGCMDSVTQEVWVDHIPMADFEYSGPCEGEFVHFTDLSEGFDSEITSWKWNFNDPVQIADTSSAQNPSWLYAQQGSNTVSLIVENQNGCIDTALIDVTIMNSPTANFSLIRNYEDVPGSVLLEDLSSGAENYLWDFGDGYEVWDNNPPVDHLYEDEGEYMITLVVWNDVGCPDTAMLEYDFIYKSLFIPNALAPASSNPEVKVFKPKGKNLSEFYIAVHDSWGNLLWESDRLDEDGRPVDAWDGTYDGKLLPTDVYIWRARAVFRDGTFWEGTSVGNNEGSSGTTQGNVTLVR